LRESYHGDSFGIVLLNRRRSVNRPARLIWQWQDALSVSGVAGIL